MPLAVILMITAIKDFVEDLKRHKSDKEENNRKAFVIRNGNLVETIWSDIMVGEIIKVFIFINNPQNFLITF
jgi:phospholipid-transporting ATPase